MHQLTLTHKQTKTTCRSADNPPSLAAGNFSVILRDQNPYKYELLVPAVYCIDNLGNHTPLVGVTVTSSCSSPSSVTTDSNGNYVFDNATSGQCQVCVTVPENCVGDRCVTITVTDLEENNGVDF